MEHVNSSSIMCILIQQCYASQTHRRMGLKSCSALLHHSSNKCDRGPAEQPLRHHWLCNIVAGCPGLKVEIDIQPASPRRQSSANGNPGCKVCTAKHYTDHDCWHSSTLWESLG